MSSQTMARWSMPLVFIGWFFQERSQGLQKPFGILHGDVVAGRDLDDAQVRVRRLHLRRAGGGVHVRARAAHGEDRAAHLADERPHVDAEVWPFTGFRRFPELVAEKIVP